MSDSDAVKISRRARFLIASVILFCLSVATLSETVYIFFSRAFSTLTQAVAEFDENERRTIHPAQPNQTYVLCLIVDSLDDPLPPINIGVKSLDGRTVPTSTMSGWTQLFGRRFQHVLRIEPGTLDEFEIVADVTDPSAIEGRADFAVFVDPKRTAERYIHRALPWWIVSLALFLASLASLLIAVFWKSGDGLPAFDT